MSAADRAAIDALVARFFAAFDNRHGAAPVASLRELCLAEALIVKCAGSAPEPMTLDGFIAPRERLLADGSLTGFSEREVESRTEVHGDMAQRTSRYEKSGVRDGVPFAAAGIKTLTLVRTAAGWRICAVAWDDQRPGFAPSLAGL